MRVPSFAWTFLVLSGALFAQTPLPNEFHLFDGASEYAYRALQATQEGELLQEIRGSFFGGLRRAVGIRAVLQDQDASTAETVWVVVRKADSSGKPDLSAAGLLLQEGPFNYSGKATGVRAWNIRFTFSKTLDLPEGTLFYGIRFASGRSGSDYGSLQMSGDYPRTPCGEHPRKGVAPGMAWKVVYSSGKPQSASVLPYDLAWDMGLLLLPPVIQGYAVDPASRCLAKKGVPDFGYAALWPDLADLEGYGYKARFGWRVRESNLPGAGGFVFLSSKLLSSPYLLPGYGRWYLDPMDPWFVLILPVALDFHGDGRTAALDPPALVRTLLVGSSLHAQGLVLDAKAGKVRLTGRCRASF